MSYFPRHLYMVCVKIAVPVGRVIYCGEFFCHILLITYIGVTFYTWDDVYFNVYLNLHLL